MAEIRRNDDGTVRWRGEDPAEAMAAIIALGDEGPECSLHGIDSTELPDIPDEKAKREKAIKDLPDVDLIEEPPEDSYVIVNEATGVREQVRDNPDDARRACDALAGQGARHLGKPVTYRVERVSGLVLP